VPRSLCGLPVERSNGKPWGVLVLDSTDPKDLRPKAERYYDVVKRHLSRLVERA
jgi:hypothetical protein